MFDRMTKFAAIATVAATVATGAAVPMAMAGDASATQSADVTVTAPPKMPATDANGSVAAGDTGAVKVAPAPDMPMVKHQTNADADDQTAGSATVGTDGSVSAGATAGGKVGVGPASGQSSMGAAASN